MHGLEGSSVAEPPTAVCCAAAAAAARVWMRPFEAEDTLVSAATSSTESASVARVTLKTSLELAAPLDAWAP